VNVGRRRELYYFRDEQGLEVDFLVPGRSGAVALVECKAARTVTPVLAGPMRRLAEAMKRKRQRPTAVEMFFSSAAKETGSDSGNRSRRARGGVAGFYCRAMIE
jgi:hypothetical protein